MNAKLEMGGKERTQQLEIANQELLQEISERQQLQHQLLHMALHDRLTGLPNPALFAERLEAAKDLNCDCAQGYLFSKPVDSQLAGDLLASTPHW
mgnify:CR=1 FL=1